MKNEWIDGFYDQKRSPLHIIKLFDLVYKLK